MNCSLKTVSFNFLPGLKYHQLTKLIGKQRGWVSDWLTKAVGQTTLALPVLVFPGWYVKHQTNPPFPIINHKQLLGTIRKLNKNIYNQEQINAIAYQIAQRCTQGC